MQWNLIEFGVYFIITFKQLYLQNQGHKVRDPPPRCWLALSPHQPGTLGKEKKVTQLCIFKCWIEAKIYNNNYKKINKKNNKLTFRCNNKKPNINRCVWELTTTFWNTRNRIINLSKFAFNYEIQTFWQRQDHRWQLCLPITIIMALENSLSKKN